MPVRIADSMKQMNDLSSFPVAYGADIWLDKNKGSGTANYDSIQNMLNNDELGGGSTTQVDLLPVPSVDELGKIYQFIGSTGTYVNGYFYECVASEDNPPVYSWVQKNVQSSNATATDVSYDNTISELTATNVQDAIDEIKGGLGTASGKNFTDLVRPNSHELVESGSVYSAINNALSSIYTPRGELTCAELTSSLLIEDNVGNIYTMSDSGTTSALFINGAGQTINVNDNVGIIKAGANTYLFNLMGDAFDLHDYQKKELSTTIASATTVEGALSTLNNGKVTKYNYTMAGTASLEDDIKTFVTALIALGANTYVGFFNRSGNLGTAGNYSITVYAEEGTSTFASGYIALGAGALGKTQYIVSYYKPTGSSEEWTIKKLAIIDDILDNNYNSAFMASSVAWFKTGNLFAYPNAGGFYSSTFLMSDRDGAWTGILKIADDGAGSATATIVSLGASPRGGEEFYYDETSYCLYFCGTWDRITITQLTGKKADLSITSTTQEEAKQNIKIVPTVLATTDDLIQVTLFSGDLNTLGLTGVTQYKKYYGTSTSITANAPTVVFDPRIYYIDIWQNAGGEYYQKCTVVGLDWSDASAQNKTFIRSCYFNGTNFVWANWTEELTTSNLTSAVTQGSTAPITSGGVYDALKNTYPLTRVDEHTCTFDLSVLPYAENGLCLINLVGGYNLESSVVCSIGYYNGWRVDGVTTLVNASNVGTITTSVSGSTLTISNTGINYNGKLTIRVGQLFI